MAQNSAIEWTDATWNPVTGCSKISAGCKNCYAERMAKRLQAMGQPRYRAGFQLTLQPDLLQQPLRWKHSKLMTGALRNSDYNRISSLSTTQWPRIRDRIQSHTGGKLVRFFTKFHLCGRVVYPKKAKIHVIDLIPGRYGLNSFHELVTARIQGIKNVISLAGSS